DEAAEKGIEQNIGLEGDREAERQAVEDGWHSGSEPQRAARQRRAQENAKERVDDAGGGDAERQRRQQRTPLDKEDQDEQEERPRQRESERHEQRHGRRGEGGDQGGMRQIGPAQLGESRAPPRLGEQAKPAGRHQRGERNGEHPRAGRAEGAERQVAARRQHEGAGKRKDAAGHVISSQDHAPSSRSEASSRLRMKSGLATLA